MPDYTTPGVYIEEVPPFPKSIASVETPIPAFIGYTEKAQLEVPGDLHNKPTRITSLQEYEKYFGYPSPENGSITVSFTSTGSRTNVEATINETLRSKFLMHYSLQLFFANGGGPCWITSVGDYVSTGGQVIAQNLKDGLAEVAKVNEVTLLLFPDAMNLETAVDYYDLYTTAIAQAATLQDRFVIMDVYHDAANGDNWNDDVNGNGRVGGLRNSISSPANHLKYAAVYFPKIYTSIDYNYKMPGDQSTDNEASTTITGAAANNLADLKQANNAQYFQAKNAINNIRMLLPASPAIAGIYSKTDKARGVWKAPATINIEKAIAPQYLIINEEQQDLNVDTVAGKSINVIRRFEGRGSAIVWGARTLAGFDNEWRYISVCRYFIMVKESVKNAMEQFVFEPNDHNTWTRIKTMIENYLVSQWRSGALMGAIIDEAYFVHVGLGQTMTNQDILEGRMIVQIGLAVIRPAEFITSTLTLTMSQGL